MTHIDRLNRRLGEALGYCGTNPRFAWKRAAEVFYFFRPQTALSFQRFCWADHIGNVWVLCQWRLPTFTDQSGQEHVLTREEWWASFKGEFPYPERGMYYAHPETAIRSGYEPDAEDTAYTIRTIRTQAEKSHANHLAEINERLELGRVANKREFKEMAADDFPAFWKNGQGHEPGTRGAHVSFGGI